MSDEEEPRLNLFSEYDDAPHLFLHDQPEGTTGLARRLDPSVSYVACRWDWEITPKDMLADPELLALVRAPKTGREFLAWPADWGPLEDTDRAADISKGLMDALGIGRLSRVNVVEALRNQPLILALVIINMIVLAGFAFTLHQVSNSIERKDALVAELIRNCTKP